ncbi:MAG: hypothetical protein QXQ02_02235, partial [Halobacteria archaeon]
QLLAPYRVGQEFSYPGAMACCGPYGAASRDDFIRHVLAIAADIRAPRDVVDAYDGAVYAERGVPIAAYNIVYVDETDGIVDMISVERCVPYDPLDLLSLSK